MIIGTKTMLVCLNWTQLRLDASGHGENNKEKFIFSVNSNDMEDTYDSLIYSLYV